MYIYRLPNWPKFEWNTDRIINLLSEVRSIQGGLIGKMSALGFDIQDEASLASITSEIVQSSKIEGEHLNAQEVRSSVARRLGLESQGILSTSRNVDGVVEMMLNATQNYSDELSHARLHTWHAALFPTGQSGLLKITVGDYRKDETGPMQVVSGPMGREKVHFQAPDSSKLSYEMTHFIEWFNTSKNLDPVLKAALAHFWFVTIHPMDDGNGRMARAIAEMQLCRADKTHQRFYSMSTEIERRKNDYYQILEQTQKGTMDITNWLEWFLHCLLGAITNTQNQLYKVFEKAAFWKLNKDTPLNERQRKIILKLQENFFGKLSSSKYAKMCKCSQDTAHRDIIDLMEKEIFVRSDEGGRSTTYSLVNLESKH